MNILACLFGVRLVLVNNLNQDRNRNKPLLPLEGVGLDLGANPNVLPPGRYLARQFECVKADKNTNGQPLI